MSARAPHREGSRPRILCVEDEVELRIDMAEELEEAGYTVVEAANAAEALAQIDAMRPDLILCDINMPGANGYDVLRTLRDGHPELAGTPFIFLTALADRREVVEGKRAGADDYLVKPVDFDLMLATVHARLRQIDRIRVQKDAELEQLRFALTGHSGTDLHHLNTGVVQALDLVATGVVLIDCNGSVCLANRAARELAGDTLAIQIGEPVRALTAMHRPRLQAVIDRIAVGARNRKDDVGSCALPRAPGQRDLILVACAMSFPGDAGKGRPIAALFITDPDKRPRVAPSVLASLFGLTPAEADIAVELADGKRPAEIATVLGVAQTTVAFHMRNLFQKTNTNRQAELVALILTGPTTVAVNHS